MRVQPWDTQRGLTQVIQPISWRVKVGLARAGHFLGKCFTYVLLCFVVLLKLGACRGEMTQKDLEGWSGSFLSLGEAGKGLTRDAEPKEKQLITQRGCDLLALGG